MPVLVCAVLLHLVFTAQAQVRLQLKSLTCIPGNPWSSKLLSHLYLKMSKDKMTSPLLKQVLPNLLEQNNLWMCVFSSFKIFWDTFSQISCLSIENRLELHGNLKRWCQKAERN